jgi:hypothetical protein
MAMKGRAPPEWEKAMEVETQGWREAPLFSVEDVWSDEQRKPAWQRNKLQKKAGWESSKDHHGLRDG